MTSDGGAPSEAQLAAEAACAFAFMARCVTRHTVRATRFNGGDSADVRMALATLHSRLSDVLSDAVTQALLEDGERRD